jgi:putative oxidoreductase
MDATRYLPFTGRLLIGLPFAMSGFGKLTAYGPTTAKIAAVGLPSRRSLSRWPSHSSSAAG